jgi:L-ascorbate metabolism protein UlaG (beta-lactamase superfamily)
VQPSTEGITIWWLGQAGFALKYHDTLILIDPYLSDFLAKKYQGREFPHVRMMPPPVLPEEIHKLDLLLCTHRHSDHLDPETVPVLSKNNPTCPVVIPRAEQAWGQQLGIPSEQMQPINAGERMTLAQGITVEAIPAAHEEFKINEQGEHHFLGYLLTLGNMTIYHSGDCVPYAGLENMLQRYSIDIALLPTNGRDEYRKRRGIAGNFTLDEAIALCKHTNIPILLCHHFGMFDFNTVNAEEAERKLQQLREDKHYVLTKMSIQYMLSRS